MSKKTSSKTSKKAPAKTGIQTQLQNGLAKLESETRSILNELGADLSNEDNSLKAIVARIRAKNPSIKALGRNLDTSTYDLRQRANWNIHMMSAYAKLQAEKTFENDVKPKIELARDSIEARVKTLTEKAGQLVARQEKQEG